MTFTTRGATVRLVHKSAAPISDAAGAVEHPQASPAAEVIRREIDTLSRCECPGVVRLLAHGERPAPWFETEDAGAHTLASPPIDASQLTRALANLAGTLGSLHRSGWAHLNLEPAHVIWRRSAPDASRPGSNPDVAVTLCSLGSAVQPAGPAEQYADREALAEVMVAALVASAMHHAPPGLRSAIGALAAELRSGNLVDLASAASSLDHLADDAAVAGPFVQGPGEGPPPRQAGDRHPPSSQPAWVKRLTTRYSPARRHVRRGVGVAVGLTLVLLSGTVALKALGDPPPAVGSPERCIRPRVPPPRVDPTGSGCGVSVDYRAGVLTVGHDRWSLGNDVVDGVLIDTDHDGWTELVALRRTGEVFLVRRFPSSTEHRMRFRPIATVPSAQSLTRRPGGSGLGGLATVDSHGDATPLDTSVSAS